MKQIVFFDFYGVIAAHGRLLPGRGSLLSSLAESHELFVVSSMPRAPLRSFLEGQDLSRFFVEIIGYGEYPDKAAACRSMAERYGFDARGALFVTDTQGDADDVSRAGVPCLLVEEGDSAESIRRAIHRYFIQKGDNRSI